MQNRGFVSTYFIIGLVVIILFIGVFYLNNQQIKTKLSPDYVVFVSEAENIPDLIDKCFENEIKKALLALGFQGGHIAYPEPGYNITRGLVVGYGLYENENLLPIKGEVSLEISEFVNFDIKNCVNFSLTDFKIEENKIPTSRVTISKDNVNAKFSWPVTVSQLEKSVTFDDVYEFNIPVSLGNLLDVSHTVVSYMKANDGYVNINYLEETGLKAEIIKIDETQSLIKLTDENSKINEESYIFQFVNKVS